MSQSKLLAKVKKSSMVGRKLLLKLTDKYIDSTRYMLPSSIVTNGSLDE